MTKNAWECKSKTDRVLPVMDVKQGQVVRGLAGRREEYRPLRSRLVPSADPVQVARAFQERLGCQDLYLADLDAICSGRSDPHLYGQLAGVGLRLWLDAGVRSEQDGLLLTQLPIFRVVLGLETLQGLEVVRSLCARCDPERFVFSLDLRDGQPLVGGVWPSRKPHDLVQAVADAGIRTIIVLDLSRVGTGLGTGTEALCRQLRDRHPQREWILGGGIGTVDDLRRAFAAGASKVLVASALHDGRLTPADWLCLAQTERTAPEEGTGPSALGCQR